jgi:hypothetical protein
MFLVKESIKILYSIHTHTCTAIKHRRIQSWSDCSALSLVAVGDPDYLVVEFVAHDNVDLKSRFRT